MSKAFRAKRLSYRSAVEWVGEKRGRLTAGGLPPLEVAMPPEFKGHPGLWSPEHLLVCAVNACIMTTFLAIAEKHNVTFLSYESEAVGTVETVDGKFMFSRIEVFPAIVVRDEEMATGAQRAIEGAHRRCLISLSLKTEVVMHPEVAVKDERR
jgi:organic hydroperoxide reductase OsmC/OhrA